MAVLADKKETTAHRDSSTARRLKREMIIMETTSPRRLNCNPPQVARQDNHRLFAVPGRRARYDEGNIEAAEYILADPRRVRHAPRLVGWARSTVGRPPWITLSAADDKATVEAAKFVLEDPSRVRHSPLLILWAETVMQRVRGNEGCQ